MILSQLPPELTIDKTVLGHPPGLFLLFFVEMWERFSYYGMRALLILYLVHEASGANPGRGWSKVQASTLYGWYTALAYLLPLFGGLIADRCIGTHRSLILGGVLIALGHLTLTVSGLGSLSHSLSGVSLFMAGLALILIGTGHFKPTVSVMVSHLYPLGDPRRDGAFTIFYMGVNLGAFLCLFVCGTLGEKVGWHWGFGAAAVGMAIGLVTYLVGSPRLLPLPDAGALETRRAWFFMGGALLLSAGVAFMFYLGGFTLLGSGFDAVMDSRPYGMVVSLVILALTLAGSIWFVGSQEAGQRGPTTCILIFIAFNAVFWCASEQAGSSLNLFASEKTDRWLTLPGRSAWEVPASWFLSINPLVIILFGPAFAALWSGLARRKRNPSQGMKIAIALILVGLGYLFMVSGGLRAQGGAKVGMIWLLGCYTLQTVGELCMSPTGLAFVTKTAPVRSLSLLMGIWFLANAIANKVSGVVAGQTDGIEHGTITLPWYPWFKLGGQADFYLFFVVICVVAGLLIAALSPLCTRLLEPRKP